MSSESLEPKPEAEKHHAIAVSTQEVDTGAQLAAGFSGDLEPEEALRIRRKIDWHILPLMFMLYWVQFMDKTTLGSAAIMGIITDTNLTNNQYNWLGTVFYLAYLAFEYPQNLALQRFPVGKWMSINVFIWGIVLCCHAACKNFAGLMVCRILLGVCEGAITAGFMIITSMFYTRKEQTLRTGYWFLMNGTALIIGGFISFGSLHIRTPGFASWKWLMIITGIITLVLAVCYWFLFPDSPTTAWFLTKDERIKAVNRIKENQTGVENKKFKKEQMIEALQDPKTWIFAVFAALTQIANSLTNQQSIILKSFGFTTLQTTLLNCAWGAITIFDIWSGVALAARFNQRAYVGVAYFIPSLVAILIQNLLSGTAKVGLLITQLFVGIHITSFVLALGWVGTVTAGHTKKVVTNAIMLSAYCIGNAAGPFMWQEKYKPRNHVPWIIICACDIVAAILLLVLRCILAKENRKRESESTDDTYDDVYIERVSEDGAVTKVRVEKQFLDLTDRQNRDFRYVL